MFSYLIVFIISMVPLVELRGAVPFAVGFHNSDPVFNMVIAYILIIIGNMIPVPFIYLFARKILEWGKDKPVIGKFFTWCLEKGQRLLFLLPLKNREIFHLLSSERRKGREEAGRKGKRRAVRGTCPFCGHTASRNRSLDRNAGSQHPGYGF